MHRDMDLARNILSQIEFSNKTHGSLSINIPGKSKDEISYHIKLLSQAGLIKADCGKNSNGLDWKAKSITMEGHKFLDYVRDQSDWDNIKQYITKKGFSITFKSLRLAFSVLIEQQLKY